MFTGGLASLLQVRVTLLPDTTCPGGSTDTEALTGGPVEQHTFILNIKITAVVMIGDSMAH